MCIYDVEMNQLNIVTCVKVAPNELTGNDVNGIGIGIKLTTVFMNFKAVENARF